MSMASRHRADYKDFRTLKSCQKGVSSHHQCDFFIHTKHYASENRRNKGRSPTAHSHHARRGRTTPHQVPQQERTSHDAHGAISQRTSRAEASVRLEYQRAQTVHPRQVQQPQRAGRHDSCLRSADRPHTKPLPHSPRHTSPPLHRQERNRRHILTSRLYHGRRSRSRRRLARI